MALLVVEHLMGFIDQVTDRVIVMNAGKEIFEGNLADARHDKRVVEVFLGRRMTPERAARRVSGIEAGYGRVQVLWGAGLDVRDARDASCCSAPTAPARRRC